MSIKSKLAFEYAGNVNAINLNFSGDIRKEINKSFKAGYDAALGKKQVKKVYKKPTEKLVDDMKMLRGIPPHDNCANMVMNDGHFSNDLMGKIARAGCDWDEVFEEARKQGREEISHWDL